MKYEDQISLFDGEVVINNVEVKQPEVVKVTEKNNSVKGANKKKNNSVKKTAEKTNNENNSVKETKSKFDVHEKVTNEIIAEMEKGIIPWQKPWKDGINGWAYNYKSKKPYILINQFMLKHHDGYLSFKQVSDMGGRVKKGAKAETVYQWFPTSKVVGVNEETGDPVVKKWIQLTYSKVFWIGDVEGIDFKTPTESKFEHSPIEEAEKVISDYVESQPSLKFRNEGNSAFYRPFTDEVVVPKMEQFKNVEEYYATCFHECTHSTGHASRLARDGVMGVAAFGSETYSKEELVAELGSAMLVNYLGLETEKSFKNSVAYLQSWLNALKNDKKLIVSAATRAEKAIKYILGEGGEENG